NHLGQISSRSKSAKYGAVHSGGDYAETSFRVLGQYLRGIWIEAIPKTGRKHQIRVHLSEYGLPIFGDDLYGTNTGLRNIVTPRLMLHAVELRFTHPTSNRIISVKSALPADFVECLKQIRNP